MMIIIINNKEGCGGEAPPTKTKGAVTLQNFPSTFEFDVNFSCFDDDFLVSSSRILKIIPSTLLFVYISESAHFKSSKERWIINR